MEDKGRKRGRSSTSSGASPGIMIRPPQPRPPSPNSTPPSGYVCSANRTLYGQLPETPNTPNTVFDNSYVYSPVPVYSSGPSGPNVNNIPLTQSTMIQPSSIITTNDNVVSHTVIQDSVISDIYNQLGKLDSLKDIFVQLRIMNEQFNSLSVDVQNLKQEVNNQTERMGNLGNDVVVLNQRLAIVELERDDLWSENTRLREDILRLQTQSMKENLIFSGIPEDRFENTEDVVKNFITDKLQIEDPIEFQAVHRLKHKPGGGPRSIVVRFEKRKDKTRVLKASPKLRGQSAHVFEQYPAEISERRKRLIPKMKEMRDLGYFTEIRYDKLFVNGRLYDPSHTYEPVNNFGNNGFRRNRNNAGDDDTPDDVMVTQDDSPGDETQVKNAPV